MSVNHSVYVYKMSTKRWNSVYEGAFTCH